MQTSVIILCNNTTWKYICTWDNYSSFVH